MPVENQKALLPNAKAGLGSQNPWAPTDQAQPPTHSKASSDPRAMAPERASASCHVGRKGTSSQGEMFNPLTQQQTKGTNMYKHHCQADAGRSVHGMSHVSLLRSGGNSSNCPGWFKHAEDAMLRSHGPWPSGRCKTQSGSLREHGEAFRVRTMMISLTLGDHTDLGTVA